MINIQKLYKKFILIRFLEEEIVKKYSEGKMRCPTHISIGQEAISVAFSQVVDKKDFTISTHRPHAHYIAKGGNINSLVAELYGKKTGCSMGKGGSMHLIDLSVNFMGSSSILGNNIPIGVGLGLSLNIKNKNNISYIFLGDGATEQGVFYESINFAVVKKIPTIFICENNFYSVYSNLEVRQPKNRSIHKSVKAMGIKSFYSNGKNILQIIKAMNLAKKYVKEHQKPCFLEIKTFRWLEHCGVNNDDNLNYRKKNELKRWKKIDHLNFLKSYLEDKKINTNLIDKKIMQLVKNAFTFAEKSNFPSKKILMSGIYAEK